MWCATVETLNLFATTTLGDFDIQRRSGGANLLVSINLLSRDSSSPSEEESRHNQPRINHTPTSFSRSRGVLGRFGLGEHLSGSRARLNPIIFVSRAELSTNFWLSKETQNKLQLKCRRTLSSSDVCCQGKKINLSDTSPPRFSLRGNLFAQHESKKPKNSFMAGKSLWFWHHRGAIETFFLSSFSISKCEMGC